MLEGHTSEAFDGALASLHLRVIAMGSRCREHARIIAQHVRSMGADPQPAAVRA